MKGHNTLMSRVTDEWSTPRDFFVKVHAHYHFDLDAAATPENACVPRWLGPGGIVNDAMSVRWSHYGQRIWCNPQYSRLREFLAKGEEAMRDGTLVVFLIPARTDTKAWHNYIWDEVSMDWRHNVRVQFIRGRLKFGGATAGAPFPSALVIFDAQGLLPLEWRA
jgi:phage N-6-adenine-methyltransferase